jgi:hypothetical protein
MSLIIRTLGLFLVLSSAAFPASTQEIDATADALTERLQTQFAEAYNRKDVMTMAGFFAEKGWRITPSGVFQGRDAIRRNMQSVIEMGLHDYSVRRTISNFSGKTSFTTLANGEPSSVTNNIRVFTQHFWFAMVMK